LNPDLINKFKYIATHEKKTISQMIEEGVEFLVKKYGKGK